MTFRELPLHPHLEHLKHEAKALHRSFRAGDAAARARVRAVLGERGALRLTEAQRVIAREYGFATWARLRAHVQSVRGVEAAAEAFLSHVGSADVAGALAVLRAEPRIAAQSVHVAAVLGDAARVRALLAEDGARVQVRLGTPAAEPLLWLCHSPFHGESAARDEALAATARVLLEAGADPNAKDARYGVPALYAVTGVHNVPRLARMLLEAGAAATDGESVFHAAERFHVEALELLLEYGVQLNATGEWGNTPLYYLLRYWDVAREARVRRGFEWLLAHGADPNVRCGGEQETALHVAVRRGQHEEVVGRLLAHGADVHARRGDGRSAWLLARRGGHDRLAAVLAAAGAPPEPLTPVDALLAACGRGDADAARAQGSAALVDALSPDELRGLPQAAADGRAAAVQAFVVAGFPVNTADESGASALHHAAIRGAAGLIEYLVRAGADVTLRDAQHDATALGWACFGADHVRDPAGEYERSVEVLLRAGSRRGADEPEPAHEGVRAVLARFVGGAA